MWDTSARLLQLLSVLQSRRDWTGPQLAERLGVTTRTVRNDIERLRSLGYPVDAAPGVNGGYRLGIGAAMPPLLLDDEEAVAVVVGLRTAAGGLVTGIEDSSVRALSKLERLLPSRLRQRVSTLAKAILNLPGYSAPIDADTLTTIAAACRDNARLRFEYQTHNGTPTVRSTEPHRLISSGRRWYVLAWDTEKRDWRTFRADRMVLLLPTGPRFAPREIPDEVVAQRLSRGISEATWRYKARVTIHAPAEHVTARLPGSHVVQAIDENTCQAELGSDTPQMLALYLGMLDADFDIDPATAPELIPHLEVLARRYAQAAAKPTPERQGMGEVC